MEVGMVHSEKKFLQCPRGVVLGRLLVLQFTFQAINIKKMAAFSIKRFKDHTYNPHFFHV